MKPKMNQPLDAAASALLATAKAIEGELTVWYCSGHSRNSDWAKIRIDRLRAAIAKVEGTEGE